MALDAAQLAPHRPLPATADYLAFSGHKLYAPFGSGALVGRRSTFVDGDPFLAGGGAVDLVDLDEVVWTAPPDREEAGSPNVVGAVALHAAIDELGTIGWNKIIEHETALGLRLRHGLRAIGGVTFSGLPPRAASRRWPWPRSPSTGCTTPWWPPGSAPSGASPSVTAASVPTPISSGCWDWGAMPSMPIGTRCSMVTTGPCPERCGPAAGWEPPGTRSMRCWPRWPIWLRASPPPSPTTRTHRPGTSSHRPSCPVGESRP